MDSRVSTDLHHFRLKVLLLLETFRACPYADESGYCSHKAESLLLNACVLTSVQQFKLHSFTRQRQDENAVESNQPAKTLHQRNKSTPALNTFAATKSVSLNPLRRAAFADVSNTRNINGKDDKVTKAKNIALELKHFGPPQKDHVFVKPLQSNDSNPSRPNNLLRPLHRPQTAGVHKALPAAPVDGEVAANKAFAKTYPVNALTTFNSTTTLQDKSGHFEHAPARKTIIKRHTTIFRETSIGSTAPPIVEQPAPQPCLSEISTQISQDSSELVKEDIQQPLITSVTQEVKETRESLSAVVETASSTIVESNLHNPTTDAIQTHALPQTISHLTSHASTSEITAPREYLAYVQEEPPAHEPELYLPALEDQCPTPLVQTVLDEKVIQPQIITDLEEYWEEEEEFFDAEGCVTARSLRSMAGENTTSVMSTVIMPRVTSRVQRELSAAKDWVEQTGFAEITDDEAWDTTMVTEYGDEIFLYMRELEVCLFARLVLPF